MKKFSVKNCLIFAPIFLITNSLYAQQTDSGYGHSASPTVSVGGFVNAIGAYRTQTNAFGRDRLPDAVYADGVVDNTNPGTHNRMTSNPDFTNEAEIHVKAAGINEFGMKYGGVIELEANTSVSARNEGFNADKAYIFTESYVGKLELGNNMSVAQKMKVGPDTFARGAGGINGKYLEYINLPMLGDSTQPGVTQIGSCTGIRVAANGTIATDANCANIKLPSFILIPQLPVAHGGYARSFYDSINTSDATVNPNYNTSITGAGFNRNNITFRDGQFGDMADATKINYYTPRVSGWQFGVSATPNTGNTGTSAVISGDNSGSIKDVVSYGINYSDNFGNLGFAASLTGENGKYEQLSSATIKRNNLQAYEAGIMTSYLGLTLGGSYGIWGKSLQPKSGIYSCDYDSSQTLANQNCSTGKKFKDATYYTAGAAYQFGPFASSLTYLTSNFQENQYESLSLGVDYRMAKGLMPYVEITKYDFKSNKPKATDVVISGSSQSQLRDNNGYVVLAGLLFSF